MKAASTSTRLATGAAPSIPRTRVTEKREAPLLTVASVLPSGATVSPKGLGASTPISRPTGVTSRPLGSTAASKPSMDTDRLAGRSPAGARKRRNLDDGAGPSEPPEDEGG